MTKVTYRRKSLLGLMVPEGVEPHGGEAWQRAADMSSREGS